MPAFLKFTFPREQNAFPVDQQFINGNTKCLPEHDPQHIGYGPTSTLSEHKHCTIDASYVNCADFYQLR